MDKPIINQTNQSTPFEPKPSVLVGDSSDIYFHRTMSILRSEGVNPNVAIEFFHQRNGVLCGIKEAIALLVKVLPESDREVWALQEGDYVEAKEVALRIKAPYNSICLYETAICGMLSSGTGWATAARECVDAANGIPIISFGARHIHPNIAGNMDYASIIGGCQSCSTVLGARLAGITPSGTMPHALILILGDTIKAVQAFDKHIPKEVPRIALVDTFKDEVEESINVAKVMRNKLEGVRLDTPRERGGVTPDLVKEVRAKLNLADGQHVQIFVSGGITPDRIREFINSDAEIDGFGVGSFITRAAPNDFTADIHQIEGKPIAKRGRLPGITDNPRLERVL